MSDNIISTDVALVALIAVAVFTGSASVLRMSGRQIRNIVDASFTRRTAYTIDE